MQKRCCGRPAEPLRSSGPPNLPEDCCCQVLVSQVPGTLLATHRSRQGSTWLLPQHHPHRFPQKMAQARAASRGALSLQAVEAVHMPDLVPGPAKQEVGHPHGLWILRNQQQAFSPLPRLPAAHLLLRQAPATWYAPSCLHPLSRACSTPRAVICSSKAHRRHLLPPCATGPRSPPCMAICETQLPCEVPQLLRKKNCTTPHPYSSKSPCCWVICSHHGHEAVALVTSRRVLLQSDYRQSPHTCHTRSLSAPRQTGARAPYQPWLVRKCPRNQAEALPKRAALSSSRCLNQQRVRRAQAERAAKAQLPPAVAGYHHDCCQAWKDLAPTPQREIQATLPWLIPAV
mmetsp:Transcript_123096/g.245045  ORF Transcript_123096/g.245045 Transcript_123096/m.245045 type:complete len:344 (-) Transcript_123096:235-1266(-)